MPDTPQLREAFGGLPTGQKEGCGFPTAHLLVPFSAATGLLVDAVASPLHTGDVSGAPDLHRRPAPGDVLVGDDSFGTYAHPALLREAGLHGLFPVHHKRIVDFTPGRPAVLPRGQEGGGGGGRHAALAVRAVAGRAGPTGGSGSSPSSGRGGWTPSATRGLPASILVRELRRTAAAPGGGQVTLTMVTTPADPLVYTDAALPGPRLRRWDVETDIGYLKTAMGMDVPRCKTEAHRAQGAGRVRPRVQPRPRRDAGGGRAAGRGGGAGELHRRVEVDAARAAGGPDAEAARQPGAAGPGRAAVREAAAEAVRPD